MRILPFFLFFIVVFGPASLSFAFPLETCDRSASTADLTACLAEKYEEAQQALNDVYKTAIEASETPEQLALLKEAQKLWVMYRNAQCEHEPEGQVESERRVRNLTCMMALTDRRTSYLTTGHHHTPGEAFAVQTRWLNALAEDYPDIFWQYGTQITGDINCDGRQDKILAGMKRVAAPEIGPDQVKESSKVNAVMAVIDSLGAGRPVARLIELNAPHNESCGFIRRINYKAVKKESQIQESLPGDARCSARVEVDLKGCGIAILRAEDTSYRLDFSDPAAP